MNRIFFLSLLILMMACTKQKSDQILNPVYHEFDNGFKLIMIENHAAPMIASVIIVGSGSKYETPEENGAAHMLEHLLFNGTTSRTQEELYNEFDLYGLYVNAHTDEDYTSFMSVSQKRLFGKALEITTDMLFNSTLPPEKLEKERGIVTEEIVKDLNDEESQMNNKFHAWLYDGTPYERPVIGNKQTVATMSRDFIYQYYKTHYVPNNMQAVVIGDFDPAEMVKMFQTNVQKFPQGAEKEFIDLSKLNFTDKYGRLKTYSIKTGNYAFFALPAPLINNVNATAFDLWLEYYFGPGKRFEDIINQSGNKISELSASYQYHDQFANLIISARLDSGETAESFKKEFLEILKSESDQIQNPENFKNTLTKRWVDEILLTEKLHYFGMMKSQILAVGGIMAFKYQLDNMEKITPADIAKINKILSDYDQNRIFAKSNAPIMKMSTKIVSGGQTKQVKVNSLFKRLPNGLEVFIETDPAVPIFAAHILVKGRSLLENENNQGISDLAHRMLTTGTLTYPGEALQEELNHIGATVKVTDSPFIPYDNYYNQPDFSYIRLTTLDQFADKSIKLLAEMLYKPNWTEDEFAKQIQSQMIAISKSQDQPSTLANQQLNRTLYDRPEMGFNPQGSITALNSIALDDLTMYAKQYFAPGNLILSINTSLPAGQLIELIEKTFISDYEGKLPDLVKLPTFQIPEKEIELKSSGGSEQGFISIAIPVKINEDERPALKILSLIMSDKISFYLREKLGLAYSIGAAVDFDKTQGAFLIHMGTQKINLDLALKELKKEIITLSSEKFDESLVEKSVNAYTGRMYMRWIARDVRAFYNGYDLYQHGDPKFTLHLLEKMSEVKPESVETVAQKYLNDPVMIISIIN
jgi:zinc protease